MSSDSVEATANAEALLERKGEIERRLQDLDGVGVVETAPAIAPASSTVMPARRTTRHTSSIDDPVESEESSKSIQSHLIPYVPKTDTHWDFVMKEMMWLGADFQGERKRQVSLARKIALRFVDTFA
jgi:HSA